MFSILKLKLKKCTNSIQYRAYYGTLWYSAHNKTTTELYEQ